MELLEELRDRRHALNDTSVRKEGGLEEVRRFIR